MSHVYVEFDPDAEVLELSAVDAKLQNNPLLKGYIRQTNGRKVGEGRFEIPTPRASLSQQYQTLIKIFGKFGVELKTSDHVSDSLGQVESDERRFVEFSRRAADIWNRQINSDEFRHFVEIVEKSCTGRTFYRKQLLSAFHLAFSQNACNFSVPGAGKTSIVYAAYAYLKSLHSEDAKAVDRILIAGPLSSFKAWEDEYSEIFGYLPNSVRISGALPIEARSDYLRGITHKTRDCEITLTSYPTLANSENEFRVFLGRSDKRTMMVLDEAHYIKSQDGYQAAAVLRLAPLANARVILTGTPAPNGYEDLSNLFKFIYPDRNVVGFPAATLKSMSDGSMKTGVQELKSKIRPFYTRIRKTDLNLPSVKENRVSVKMTDAHNQIYRNLERKIVPRFRDYIDDALAPARVRGRLIRLRQASVNPELLLRPLDEDGLFDIEDSGQFIASELEIADLIRSFNSETDLERLNVCRALVENVLRDQGKVLIWSYFLGNLERLLQTFSNSAEFVEVLTGATPVATDASDDDEGAETLVTREAIIDGFHRPDRPSILIANPQAVGESISLHKACRTAIYFDRDFNAGRYIQSKDRIHRYNPDGGSEVTYYHLISRGTVDDDIDDRLLIKESRLSDLVDSDEIPLLTSSEDYDDAADIRTILEAYEARKTF